MREKTGLNFGTQVPENPISANKSWDVLAKLRDIPAMPCQKQQKKGTAREVSVPDIPGSGSGISRRLGP